MYAHIRLSFQEAVTGEYERYRLLERQMRKAGLPATSCYGPNGPMSVFRRLWIETGVAAEYPAAVRQLFLPELPPAAPALDPLAARRLAPCQELAPPAVLPPGCRQVYLSSRSDGRAWAFTVVSGGDGETDLHARRDADGSGQVGSAPRAGETPCVVAALEGVVAALEQLAGDTAPAVLRMPMGQPLADAHRATMLVAGTWEPPPPMYRQRREIGQMWQAAAAARGGALYLAGYDPTRRYPWGERAAALVSAVGMPPPDDPDTTCPMCMEDYVDMWPTPDPLSRAPTGRWDCPSANPRLRHALCRECDAAIQARPPPLSRCPICRADRMVLMAD